jgi:hypothetical protein
MQRYSNHIYVENMDPNDPQSSYNSNEILHLSRHVKRPKLNVKLRKWRGTAEQLDAKVMEVVTGYVAKRDYGKQFSAEGVGLYLNVRASDIRQSFHRLNLAGKITQRSRYYGHDTNRNPRYGGPASGWAANLYSLVYKA